jgi:hypothetical protein
MVTSKICKKAQKTSRRFVITQRRLWFFGSIRQQWQSIQIWCLAIYKMQGYVEESGVE